MDTEKHPKPAPREGLVSFGVLGPFEIRNGESIVPLNGRKQRSFLALLVLHAGQLMPKDLLIEELWGELPPRTARDSLHNYAFHARRAIGSELIRTRDQSYLLDVDPERVDLFHFERLVQEANGELSPEARAAKLRDALSLWRGSPLSDLAYEPFVLREAPRLEELRLVARQELIEAELELGLTFGLIPELEALIREHPFHERFYAQLMLALYRSGRQAEALDVYRRARAALLELLGIDPGPELRRLEQAILRQSRELDAPARSDHRASAHPGRRGRQQRLRELVRESARAVRALERQQLRAAFGGRHVRGLLPRDVQGEH